MEEKKILFEVKDSVCFVTINNPTKMNCIGRQMLSELEEVIDFVEKSEDIKAFVITGAGEKAFSAGADLKELESLSPKGMENWIIDGNLIFNKLDNLSKPTIAIINGYAIGGGFEIALACDFRIGTSNATMFLAELKNGWLPGWGGITRARRLFGEVIAKEIVLLGRRFSAEEALSKGILNRVLSSENKEAEIESFVSEFKELKSNMFVLAKTAVMDENRTTVGVDLSFDVLALKEALSN